MFDQAADARTRAIADCRTAAALLSVLPLDDLIGAAEHAGDAGDAAVLKAAREFVAAVEAAKRKAVA